MGKHFKHRHRFWRNDYIKHLASKEWQEIKKRIFAKRGKACERCLSTDHIEVHHKTYERLGNELDSDLLILCEDCHEKEHAKQASIRHIEKLIISGKWPPETKKITEKKPESTKKPEQKTLF